MTMLTRAWRYAGLSLAAVLVAAPLAACGGDDDSNAQADTNSTSTTDANSVPQVGGTVTLAYFPNLTHGSAIVGVQKGYFKDELAKNGASLKTQLFTSGSDTLEALAGGS